MSVSITYMLSLSLTAAEQFCRQKSWRQ